MFHTVRIALVLALLWLLLSGHYTPLLLSLGALSVLLVSIISRRMDLADHETFALQFGMALPGYWLWLGKEIVKANLDVVRHILAPRLSLSPTLAGIPASQRTELARVIFANSITLTPGTIALEVHPGRIEVHALTRAGAEDLLGGEMDRRVRALEGPRQAQA